MDTGMIMIDLQKAFGVLDHNKILLEKMTCLGFKTPPIKWFKSYLSNKEFFVFPNDVFSEAVTLNCGIPQRFILGLPLSLIYINDLPQSLSESGSYFYAVDTCILTKRNTSKKMRIF